MVSQTMKILATFRPLCKGILRQGQDGYLTRASEDIIRAVSNQPGERASSDEVSSISAASHLHPVVTTLSSVEVTLG